MPECVSHHRLHPDGAKEGALQAKEGDTVGNETDWSLGAINKLCHDKWRGGLRWRDVTLKSIVVYKVTVYLKVTKIDSCRGYIYALEMLRSTNHEYLKITLIGNNSVIYENTIVPIIYPRYGEVVLLE